PGDAFLARQPKWSNEFTGASDQINGSEPENINTDERTHRYRLHRIQQDLPSERSRKVGQQGCNYRGGQPPRLDIRQAGPKLSPIESCVNKVGADCSQT